MRHTNLLATLSLTLLAHVSAASAATDTQPSSPELQLLRESQQQLRQQLDALTSRVTQLEQANAELTAKNAQLAANASAAANAPASTPPAVATASSSRPPTASSVWLDRFKWNADFRLRHERIEQDGIPSRDRDRFQSHFGFEAALTDAVAVGLQLATGADDPRSANQTFTGEFSRKPVGIDLAYLRWSPAPGVALTGGKMKYPVYKPGSSKLYDSDVNPEGLALAITKSRVFANLYALTVDERAANADTTLIGAQAGTKFSLGTAGSLTATLAHSDLGAGTNRRPFFAQASNGNTLNPDGTLAFDFRVTQASLEYARTLRDLPFLAFIDAARNSDAPDDLDTAYALGFTLGKASRPRSWEFSYLYQHIEKDAWFGQIADSDFGAGLTDAEGSVFRFAYAPLTNGTVTATYYLNDLAISSPLSAASIDEYRRLQLDFTMKF